MKKTIALAEELGLARYQKLDGSANNINSHKEEPGQENLQYVLVLDFEATCWEERTSPPPEIIEFPVVLLSLRTGEILSEFHHYCLPIEYPRLSPFCKNLTGKLPSWESWQLFSCHGRNNAGSSGRRSALGNMPDPLQKVADRDPRGPPDHSPR